MGNINLAIQKIKENKISDESILCAYDIIGSEYLNGEMAYINDFDGFMDLITDWELEANEIVKFMLDNCNYYVSDVFVTFDGEELYSFEDIDFFKEVLIEKMNGECAEFILNNN